MYDSDDNEIAKALQTIGVHLKYLGVGDAATTMGAIEFLGVSLKEGMQNIAGAIRELAAAVESNGTDNKLDAVVEQLSDIGISVGVIADKAEAANLTGVGHMKWFIDIGDDSDTPGGCAVYSAEHNDELARDHYARLTRNGQCDLRLRKAPHVLDLGEIVAAHFGGRAKYWRNEEKPHIAPFIKPGPKFDPYRYG
jgi:hypothetical protein